MKIALNHTRFQIQGGVERYLWNMAHRLAERGHEVHLFCNRFSDPAPLGMFYHRVPIVRMGESLKAMSFAMNSRDLLASGRFDVVQAFGKTVYGDVYRDGSGCIRHYWDYLEKYERGIWGRIGRHMSPRQLSFAYLERRRFRPGSFRQIVCISKMVRDQVLDTYHLPQENVRVIYPGVDTEKFHPDLPAANREAIRRQWGIAPDAVVGISVATGFIRKGIRPMIEALAGLKRDDWRFLVVGRDKNLAEYAALCDSLHLHNRVFFCGWQSEVEKYLAASDYFVLNSRFDAFGNSSLEAMAMGLPCAISVRAGSSEVVEPGDNGFVIPDPDDVREISRVLDKLNGDPALRSRMGRCARLTAEKYDIKCNLEDWLSLYRKVVDEKMAQLV